MVNDRDIMVLKGVVNPKTFNLLFRRAMTLTDICTTRNEELIKLPRVGEDTISEIRRGMVVIRHCQLCIKDGKQYMDRRQTEPEA